MRKAIFIFFVLSSLSFQKDNPPKTTRLLSDSLEILNGSVKQLIEIRRYYSRQPAVVLLDTDNFDKKGNTVETISLSNIIDNEPPVKYQYIHDLNGKVVEAVPNSKSGEKIKYVYGKEGRITARLFYNLEGHFDGKGLYKYDFAGNVAEYIEQDASGKQGAVYKYKYSNNHITEVTFTGEITQNALSDGKKTTYHRFYLYKSFDSKGNWTKSIDVIQEPTGKISFKDGDTTIRKITYY